MERYSDTLVVALATAIAVLDVFFILVAVPESLPDKVRPSSWGAPINWEQADPFAVSTIRLRLINYICTHTQTTRLCCRHNHIALNIPSRYQNVYLLYLQKCIHLFNLCILSK